jgi:hypothetical protein
MCKLWLLTDLELQLDESVVIVVLSKLWPVVVEPYDSVSTVELLPEMQILRQQSIAIPVRVARSRRQCVADGTTLQRQATTALATV